MAEEPVNPAQRDQLAPSEDLLLFDWVADGAKWEAARRIMRLDHFSRHYAGRRKRLASRYLREAQSLRDKALEEFLGHELPK